MAKFLILHGTGASPEENWFMWLKGILIGRGHEVWLPQLPNADKPNPNTYNEFILANENFAIDSETILIGHSSGAVAILSLLDNVPYSTVVKAAVLVSAFKDDLGWDALKDLFIEPLDFKQIKTRCKKFVLLHSDNDPYVPLEHANYLSSILGGKLIVTEGQGHFNTEQSADYKSFPELLELIESEIL